MYLPIGWKRPGTLLAPGRYQAVIDSEGQQFLGFLREGGRRLATLINDLLVYTRAGTAEVQAEPVDANEVLEQVLTTRAEAISESHAKVTHDRLPEVSIGQAHLQQVFQNLVGNALKYRDERVPEVHISAAARGADWCFSVRDNGIGIDPIYNEKIFGVFTRLHHNRKYSGTGIGVAICQRVVERYGGHIWVESKLGKGSAFFFTIPRQTRKGGPRQVAPAAGGG